MSAITKRSLPDGFRALMQCEEAIRMHNNTCGLCAAALLLAAAPGIIHLEDSFSGIQLVYIFTDVICSMGVILVPPALVNSAISSLATIVHTGAQDLENANASAQAAWFLDRLQKIDISCKIATVKADWPLINRICTAVYTFALVYLHLSSASSG